MTIQSPRTKAALSLLVIAGLTLTLLGAVTAAGLADGPLHRLKQVTTGVPPGPGFAAKQRLLAAEVMLYGLILLVVRFIAIPRFRHIRSDAGRDSRILWATIALFTLLSLPIVLIGQSSVIDGSTYWWLRDDAMISMRYARNLASGSGLVWNPGEYVEGYSNFAWTIFMTLIHLLPLRASSTSLVILLANVALALAVIPVLIRLVRLLGGGRLAVGLSALGYALNRNMMAWTTAGFETAILALLFLVCVYRVVKEANEEHPQVLTYVLIAAMSLVRADAAVLSALLYAMSLALNARRARVVVYSAASILLPAAQEVFRIAYYGDLLPNTAYLKALNWDGRSAAGVRYVSSFGLFYASVIVLALIGAILRRHRPTRVLLGALLLYCAYVAYVGGDAFQDFRFFVPVIPVVLLLAFRGAESLARDVGEGGSDSPLGREPRSALLLAGLAIIFLSAGAYLLGRRGQLAGHLQLLVGVGIGIALVIVAWRIKLSERSGGGGSANAPGPWIRSLPLVVGLLALLGTPLVFPGYALSLVPDPSAVGNIEIGLRLNDKVPAESKVADFWAGSIFYFYEGYAIDLLGKSDRHIARTVAFPGGTKPGHNKFDFAYSLGQLKPDYVVAAFRMPVQEKHMQIKAKGDHAFVGQLYFDSLFQDHCLPNPEPMDTWRTVFRCEW